MKKEYLIYKLSEEMKEATRIDNELFPKFDVKRGLRNEDGTGVLVGLMPSSKRNVSASKKWLICCFPVACRTRKNWLLSAN